LKIPCSKTTGNLNVRNLLSFYIRSLTSWQDYGECVRYPFERIVDTTLGVPTRSDRDENE
jgi:hypothetical protein